MTESTPLPPDMWGKMGITAPRNVYFVSRAIMSMCQRTINGRKFREEFTCVAMKKRR
jgi:hypothetical protein